MLLPVTTSNAKLSIPLTHSVVRIGVLNNTAISRHLCGFFMSKIQFLLCEAEWKSFRTRQVRIAGTPILLSLAPSNWRYWSEVSNLNTEAIMPNFHAQELTKNQLTLPVSETKQKSLLAQVSIIRSAINIHGITQTQENFNTLKSDALELVRMLDEIEQNNQHKTSIFNVLAKGTRRVIAERVGFNQAIQYPNAVVKFAGMEVVR